MDPGFQTLEKKTVYENRFAMEVVHAKRKDTRRQVPYVLDLVGILDNDRYPNEPRQQRLVSPERLSIIR